MLSIIIDWRSVTNEKAVIKCEEGEEHFVANLMRRGGRIIRGSEILVLVGFCPICDSPLEDNGCCSDVGSNSCQYQL